jgi:integrase
MKDARTPSTGSSACPAKKRKHLYPRKDPKTGELKWLYFRNTDGSLIPLPLDETSQEFETAYARCLDDRHRRPHDRRPRNLKKAGANVKYGPGTIGRFIDALLNSDKFTKPRPIGYAEGTKYNYRKALELTRARLAPGLLVDLDEEAVDVYTAGIAREFGGSVADQQLYLLSIIWNEARGFPDFKRRGRHKPTLGAIKHYKVREETQAWPEQVQDRFVETAPPYLVDAYYWLRFTGQRGGDAVKFKWIDIEDGSLRLIQEKTRTPIWHKLPDPLLRHLAEMPRVSAYILTSAWKRPWKDATTLSRAISNHFRKIGIEGFKMHGLRATAAAELLSLGAGLHGVKAVSGHLSDKLAKKYARQYDQRRVNAEAVARWNDDLARRDEEKTKRRRAKLRAV